VLLTFFASILRFPNSSPLGSDLMFELPDAFIHIEIKTALIDNPADYKGKINIAINQTSYGIKGLFTPNLPQYYNPKGDIKKVCLTYIIQIIHEHAKLFFLKLPIGYTIHLTSPLRWLFLIII